MNILFDRVISMDYIDKQILLTFMDNCRISYQELANKFEISANAIKKRVLKLEELGVIESYSIELSLSMIDAEFALYLIHTNGMEDESDFMDEIGNHSAFSYIGPSSQNLYFAFATYQNGSIGLNVISSFLNKLPNIVKIETHPLIYEKGNKIELSNIQIMVLKELVDDPKKSISNIAINTGLTARLIRKTLNDFITGRYIQFSIKWNLSVGGSVQFLLRIEWDVKKADYFKIMNFLQERFPISYWLSLISAIEPVLFANFVVDSLPEVDEIRAEIRKSPLIKATTVILGRPNRIYPDIKSDYLQKLINRKKSVSN